MIIVFSVILDVGLPTKTRFLLILLLMKLDIHIVSNNLTLSSNMAIRRDNATLSNPAMLGKIDQLRDLNIGQHVPLPQVRL